MFPFGDIGSPLIPIFFWNPQKYMSLAHFFLSNTSIFCVFKLYETEFFRLIFNWLFMVYFLNLNSLLMLNIFFSPYLNSMHSRRPRLSPLSSTKQGKCKKAWALRSDENLRPCLWVSYSLLRKWEFVPMLHSCFEHWDNVEHLHIT